VNILKAVLLKLTSALMFSVMAAFVRYVSDVTPLGQVVFCRSFFAILPVMVIYAWRGELAAAFRTSRPFGHLGRGSISVAGMFVLASAFTNAGSVVQTRRLTDTETTSSIVLYFSLFCALGGLLTLPFGWIVPTLPQLGALVGLGVFGGLSHILLTESYRYAPA